MSDSNAQPVEKRFANDGLVSLTAGMGDPMRDKRATTSYATVRLDPVQIVSAYDGTWIARKVVDIPAEDATRKWRSWQADANQISAIEAEESRLNVRGKVEKAMKLARLYGGAGIVIGDGAPDLLEPLDVERIGKSGIKYLTVFRKSELTAGDTDEDLESPTHGFPLWYEVSNTVGETIKLHSSRVAAFHGDEPAEKTIDGWGVSVLQAVFDAMKNADSTANNIAAMVFEANVDVFGIPDLMNRISTPQGEQSVLSRLALANSGKSIARALVMDAEETLDRKSMSFAHLPEIQQQMLTIVAGASDIPVSRFVGISEGGLNSTGEGSERNYHEHIESLQGNQITPATRTLDECLIRSALGSRPPEVWYVWKPLRVKTEAETMEQGVKLGTMLKAVVESGLFTTEEARAAFSNAFIEAGVLPGLEAAMAETEAGGGFDLGTDEPEKTNSTETAAQETRT